MAVPDAPRRNSNVLPEVVRRIAVCLDGSPRGERALPHALGVARAFGASVTFLRVLQTPHPGEGPAPDAFEWTMCRDEARAYLDRLAAELAADAPAIATVVAEGDPAEQIRIWETQHPTDLTVLCSHGAGGRTDWPLAGTARKLVERAPGSVLLVPAGAAAPEGRAPARYRRILVPLDGSSRAESVLPLASRLARAHRAQLILAHAVPLPELTRVGPLDADDQELERRLIERNERVAHEYLDRLRARLDAADLEIRALVVRGSSVHRLLVATLEREQADLVVLSAHGSASRIEAPYGGVAAHLIQHAKVPLVIVREPPRRALVRRGETHAAEVTGRLPRQATPTP